MTANYPCSPFMLGITGNLDPLPATPNGGFDALKRIMTHSPIAEHLNTEMMLGFMVE